MGYVADRWVRSPIQITDEWLTALVISDGEPTDRYPAVTAVLISYSDYGGSDLDAANVCTLSGVGRNFRADRRMPRRQFRGDDRRGTPRRRLPVHRHRRRHRAASGRSPTCSSGSPTTRCSATRTTRSTSTNWPPRPGTTGRADVRSEVIDRLDALRCTGDRGSGQLDNGPHHHSGADQGDADGWDRWDAADESAIREAYYEASVDGWECESATSVVNRHHDTAVTAVLRAVFGVDPAE